MRQFRERFERRYGTGDFPLPGGVNTDIGDVDPASVPPHQFLQLVNVRWNGNGLEPRGGQAKVNAALVAGATASIYPVNFEMGAPYRLWLVGAGLPEVSESGRYVGAYYSDQCPRLQRVSYYSTASGDGAIAGYDGIPHITVDSQLRRLQLTTVPWGFELISLSGTSLDIPLADLPSGFKCRSMAEFDGKLFLAVWNGATGRVLAWDGVALTEELAGLGEITALGYYRDYLVAGFAAGVNQLRVRAKGTTPSWSTFGGATIATKAGNNSLRSYKDVLYGASGDTYIWSFNGTTITAAAHDITGSVVEALCVEFGVLIYGHALTSGGNTYAYIGTFNGTTWTDNVKNLSGDLAGAEHVYGLERYQGSVVAGLRPAGEVARVALSPANTNADPTTQLAATWEIVSYNGAYEGDIGYLQVL